MIDMARNGAWIVLCTLLGAGCASTTYESHPGVDGRVRGAFEQPFRDVSVMREIAPDILVKAAAAPYALDSDAACADVGQEIDALDQILGPDLDAPVQAHPQTSTDPSALLAGAIRGVMGLPYRGMVRRISGAESRERILRAAILAGMVRRAFLRGAVSAGACQSAPAP